MDLDKLTSDGDTLDMDDGRQLRLRVEPDDINVIDDGGDWFGKLEWARTTNRYGERAQRPDGFDGNAEILQRDSYDALWWQPPDDVKRTDDGFSGLRSALVDLLTYGYSVVTLELLDAETDAYGRRIVRDVASLGGVEALADAGYMAEVVGDLFAELTL